MTSSLKDVRIQTTSPLHNDSNLPDKIHSDTDIDQLISEEITRQFDYSDYSDLSSPSSCSGSSVDDIVLDEQFLCEE